MFEDRSQAYLEAGGKGKDGGRSRGLSRGQRSLPPRGLTKTWTVQSAAG